MYKYQYYAESGMFRNIFSSVASPVEEEVTCYYVLYILYYVLHVGLSYSKYRRRKGFYATGPFLYLLKTSENQSFSDVFRGIERDKGHEMD